MRITDPGQLQKLTDFPTLLAYLRDDQYWPIEVEDLDAATFDYSPQELNIDTRYAAKIKSIKQLRPLGDNQAWGIFFIEFDNNRLPVMALRRILQSLAVSRRQRSASLPVWNREDLLFISVYTSAAEGKAGQRGITFAHFRDEPGKQPELRTFSWDSRETHFYYISRLNLDALRWPKNDRDVQAWRKQWRGAFTVPYRYTIANSGTLASQMAKQAVIIRELVGDLYEAEDEQGELHALYKRLQVDLIHDLNPDDFADMIAQTVTYGVFSAAVQSNAITIDNLADFIPDTNRFLKQMLETLTTQGGLDLDELGIGQLVELLRQTDMKAITHDFGRQTGGGREDPVVHFYEQFLNEYDHAQRVQRGVFYTPDPVVEYMVHSVDEILRRPVEEGGFAIQDGLASDATTSDGELLVQILDPATGTGTFLAHIIDHIAARKNPHGRTSDAWDAYVANNLLKRLNGFELMMAPYTIAHLKLGLKLAQKGYTFRTGERLRVFLTNTLDEPVQMKETLLKSDYLSQEASEASVVKTHVPILIVIGNPPYAKSSLNQNDWINGLMEEYKTTVREAETQIQALSDDYIKFIRFSHYRIEKSGQGIIALITNNGFLDGPLARDMRASLSRDFDITIINLHGDSRKGEIPPMGQQNENVFDIQQGVAITLMVYKPKAADVPRSIRYTDVWGSRSEKYDTLAQNSELRWELVTPKSPNFLFIPLNPETEEEFMGGQELYSVFGSGKPSADNHVAYGAGFVTQQDGFAIAFEPETLIDNVNALVKSQGEAQARTLFNFCTTNQWNYRRAKSELETLDVRPLIRRCLYRPFDYRYTVFNKHICTIVRERITSQFDQPNLALLSTRRITRLPFNNVFVSKIYAEYKVDSHDRNTIVFPLYLYPDAKQAAFDTGEGSGKGGRRPNLSPAFIANISARLGLRFLPDGKGDLVRTFGPEDVFRYIYAVFHSPTYRTRYAEFLMIDFPRLPLTSDVDLFRKLCDLGEQLVGLHLMEKQAPPIASYSIPGDNTVEKVSYTGPGQGAEKGRVWINKTQYFEGVPPEVWDFHIGGYQVAEKWLKDRKGRMLTFDDVMHYQRVIAALAETIRLMQEVDEAIGEWPMS